MTLFSKSITSALLLLSVPWLVKGAKQCKLGGTRNCKGNAMPVPGKNGKAMPFQICSLCGWAKIVDSSGKPPYYYHNKTKVCQEHSSVILEEDLPADWTAFGDPNSDKIWYYNNKTKVSTFNKPKPIIVIPSVNAGAKTIDDCKDGFYKYKEARWLKKTDEGIVSYLTLVNDEWTKSDTTLDLLKSSKFFGNDMKKLPAEFFGIDSGDTAVTPRPNGFVPPAVPVPKAPAPNEPVPKAHADLPVQPTTKVYEDGCYFTDGITKSLFWKSKDKLWWGFKQPSGRIKWTKDPRKWEDFQQKDKLKFDRNIKVAPVSVLSTNYVDRRRRLINRFIRASLYCQTS